MIFTPLSPARHARVRIRNIFIAVWRRVPSGASVGQVILGAVVSRPLSRVTTLGCWTSAASLRGPGEVIRNADLVLVTGAPGHGHNISRLSRATSEPALGHLYGNGQEAEADR